VRNGRSRSSKVADFGTHRKRICNFLLVINSNLGLILPRYVLGCQPSATNRFRSPLPESGMVCRSTLRQRRLLTLRGHLPIRFTCCPLIQKLADRSDVISEVPKCSKIQIFRGSPLRIPLGELIALPRSPNWWGGGSLSPAKNPTPALSPLGLVSNGSQDRSHYRVGNPTNDRFQIYKDRIFSIRFWRTEKMDSVRDEGADGGNTTLPEFLS